MPWAGPGIEPERVSPSRPHMGPDAPDAHVLPVRMGRPVLASRKSLADAQLVFVWLSARWVKGMMRLG